MRPDSPSDLYEAIMVPFLQPTPASVFAGEGQVPSGRQQPVRGLPGFATLLGSAAPTLPIGTPEALPDAQQVSPGLAAALLVAANEDAASAVGPAPIALEVEAEAAAPVVAVPVSAPPPEEAVVAATAPDPAPPPAAPVQRGAPQRPALEASHFRPPPAMQDRVALSAEPFTPDRATVTIEAADEPIAEPRTFDADPALDSPIAVRDPLLPAAVLSPAAAPVGPSRAAPSEAPISDVPAQLVPLAPTGKVPPQQPPADKGPDSREQPCSVTPKTVPTSPAPTNPDALAPEITPEVSPGPPTTEARWSGESVPAVAPSIESPVTPDARATPVAVAHHVAPGEPISAPTETTRLIEPAIYVPLPLSGDDMATSIPRDLPSAPPPREGATLIAPPASQDVATLGDAPHHLEAPALRGADPQPVQRAPVESAGSANADGGESGPQTGAPPAIVPAPVATPASTPITFDQLVAGIDAPAPGQSAEPRARAAAIGEDVAVAIVRHAESGADNVLVIRLDPGDLGRIEVRLKVEEGQRLSAELTADQPATLDLLRRESDNLSRALHDAGFRTEGQSLRFDGRGTGQGGEGLGQQERRTVQRAYLGEDDPVPSSASAHSPQVRSAGRIDLFA